MTLLRKLKNFAHLLLAFTANVIYSFPGRGLVVIGVTGTDGKTTTANLIYHILTNADKKTAVISTIGAIIDGKKYETGFHVTTPSPFSLQKYIKLAKKKGCSHVILEVTSHALDQKRVWGIPFALGVLTNITHEHLDYHKNYKTYVHTKLKLLQSAKMAIVNSDGEWFAEVVRAIPFTKMKTYSLHGARDNDLSLLTMPFRIKTQLLGDFNLENIIAATAACQYLAIPDEDIEKAIESFKPPVGRQEIIEKRGIKVMIDFAHTPNSLESILPVVRKRTEGRLIHVFGSAGERDSKKRPEMGKAAAFYDDIIILTSEDPRSENVRQINQQIKRGIEGFSLSFKERDVKKKSLIEIDNRKEAIKFAIQIAKSGDTIIITGKGHEKSMNYGNGEEYWSDQEVVKEFLEKI